VSIDQLVGDLIDPSQAAPTIRVDTLEGNDLDRWVAKAHGIDAQEVDGHLVYFQPGFGQRPVPAYSSDWAHGGPVVERAEIHLETFAGASFDGAKVAAGWLARSAGHSVSMIGPKPLVAAMRAFLCSKYGPHIIR
jgi:hypothetical protein